MQALTRSQSGPPAQATTAKFSLPAIADLPKRKKPAVAQRRQKAAAAPDHFDPRIAHLSDQQQAGVIRDLLAGLSREEAARIHNLPRQIIETLSAIYGVRQRRYRRTIAARQAAGSPHVGPGRPRNPADPHAAHYEPSKSLRFCPECGAGYYRRQCPVHGQRIPLANREQKRHRSNRRLVADAARSGPAIRVFSVSSHRRGMEAGAQ